MGELLGVRPAAPPAGNGTEPAHVVRRRRPLPSGRAAAGAFLVSLAAMATFTAYTGAARDRRVAYVVAAHDLRLGHTLTTGDLAFARADVPAGLAARTFRDPSRLVGAVLVAPVGAGELVQASSVRRGSAASGDGRELSIPIDAARAVDGTLRRGELVDVLVTFGTGPEAYTVVVARAAQVVDLTSPRNGLAGGSDRVLTLRVATGEHALAVAHASSAGALTVVRSPSGSGSIAPADGPYRAPAAPPASDSEARG